MPIKSKRIRKSARELNYKVIATKVSPAVSEMLQQIAAKNGTTPYELLQNMVAVIVRLMSDDIPLTDDLALMMHELEGVGQWHGRMNACTPSAKKKIKWLFAVLGSAEGKKGSEAVMLDGNKENHNVARMLEVFLCEVCPSMYRRLRAIGVELECRSIYETLERVIELQKTDPNEREIRALFSDNNRSEFGVEPVDEPYKRIGR